MKKRKIGILTQPLMTNYGGLLQNYALQKVLRDMGHDVETIRSKWKTRDSLKSKFLYCTKLFVYKFVFKRYTGPIIPYFLSIRERSLISKNTDLFIEQNIKTTKVAYRKIDSRTASGFNYDVYIVGSDQVWRPAYSSFLPNFFLDFTLKNNSLLRIAYAASFGVDNWELSAQQTNIARFLLNKFDVVTVRENSGIDLCEKFLNVKARHVLDPTMLLHKEDYIKLVYDSGVAKSEGNLMVYILDQTDAKQEIINAIISKLGLKPFNTMPKEIFCNKKPSIIENYIYAPVESWVRGFIDADFIVTDSFHGTVFSIIFNKQFVSIGNKNRGLSRFISLLSMFNLNDRLIFSIEDLGDLLEKPVNYNNVNLILSRKREYSIKMLESCLK